jgi:hypothetical protein
MGTWCFGEDDDGQDVYFYGATSGSYMQWDASADKLLFVGTAQIDIGASADGVDTIFYGDTAGSYVQWDASDNALEFVGLSKVDIGSSGTPLVLSASAPYVEVHTTTAATSGTLRSFHLNQTHTAEASAGAVEALRAEITADVKTGAWANAIVGSINYSTSGAAHGMAAAICAEMIPPNNSLERGALYALDLEVGCGASSSWGSAGPVAFMKMENWGTATHFSANAFLFHLAGETGAAGALLGANNNTLKVRIGTTTEYLFLSEYEDTISIGLTGAKKTLVTGVPEIAVWSTSALTSGTQDIVKIDYTHTAAASSGYIKGIRCTMTSDVKTPGSLNAIKGIIDYQTDGHAHGDCAPLAAELTMPNSSAPRGTFYLVDLQVSAGASSSWQSAGPLAFIKFGALGTKTELDDHMYLFDITGFTGGDGHMFDNAMSEDTSPAINATLKIRIDGTDWWIPLSDTKDCS